MAPSTALLHRHRPPENLNLPPPAQLRPAPHMNGSGRGSTASFAMADSYPAGQQDGRAMDRTGMTMGQPQLSRRPHFLHPHKRTSSTPSISTQPSQQHHQQPEPPRPRKVVPPPKPVFPPSPPLSPEMATLQMEEQGKGKGRGVEAEGEEEQLKRALEASMQDQRTSVERADSNEELARALAESRALEQRRSTYEAQEQNDLEAALLASQHDLEQQQQQQRYKPPSPPTTDPSPSSSDETNQNRLYRPRSSSLPTFSPSDLSYPSSSFPAEKSRAFPFLRPALPPGAAGAWDDESREMEMLALAIRISEEEEKERERLEKLEEERAVERVREAEKVAMARVGGGSGPGSSEEGTNSSNGFTSSTSLAPTAPAAAPTTDSITPATTLASSTTSGEKPSSLLKKDKDDKEKKRSSWFRPPLASKLSTAAEPSLPPLSTSTSTGPPTRPPLPIGQQSSATTVQTFRTARESLPFSNFDAAPASPVHEAVPLPPLTTTTKPTPPRVLRKLSRPPPPLPPHPPTLTSTSASRPAPPPPPPKPTRLPPTPPETPQTASTATFSPHPSQRSMEGGLGSTPFLPSTAAPPAADRFREDHNGSPVEMPYLTPSRSSSMIGSGSGEGHRERVRTMSGATAFSSARSHGESGGSAGSDESGSGEGDEEASSVLAVRNPDEHFPSGSASGASSTSTSKSSPSLEGGGNGALSAHSYTSTTGDTAYDGVADIDAALARYPAFPEDEVESLWSTHDHPLPQHLGGGGPYFESAYAGRSMSAIDEMTEPASSVVGTSLMGTDGGGGGEGPGTRQGSFPSTFGGSSSSGGGAPGGGGGSEERREPVGEGLWLSGVAGEADGENLVPFPKTASPVSSLARPAPAPRPASMRRGSSSSSSASPSRSGHGHLVATYSPSLPQQHHHQTAIASPTFPAPSSPSLGTSSTTAQGHFPVVSPPQSATGATLPLPPTSLLPSDPSGSPPGTTTPPHPASVEEGLRFGYPSHCARAPAHSCPDDGLSSSTSPTPAVVPSAIELSSPSSDGIGLRIEDAPAPKDSWAVEARSWVALVRFLLWHGDVSLLASSADVARSPSGRCAAEARLEFRPDDEGGEVVRLVVELVKPEEAQERLAKHRELSVTYPLLSSSSTAAAADKGKGKARAVPPSPSTANVATFSLPDVLHLPTRLSSLAIQLYTLRHLASIARATQPARSPPPPVLAVSSPSSAAAVEGYPALRALADSISSLAKAAAEREQSYPGSASAAASPGERTPRAGQTSGGRPSPAVNNTPAPEEQNQRLVDRLRERLRRLKRHGGGGGGGGGDENAPPGGLPPLSASTGSAPSYPLQRLSSSTFDPQARRSSKLVKPQPPPRTQAVPRSERVLSAAQTVRSGEVGDGFSGFEEAEERRDEVGLGRMDGRGMSREEEERWEVVDRPRGRRTSTQSQLRYLPEI